MKLMSVVLLFPLFLAATFGSTLTRTLKHQVQFPRTATLVGEIMDSKCATVGSHDSMMKKAGSKDARDCTLMCAKDGSFVLYEPSSKTVYQLNDQQKPVKFAGQMVKISGAYDEKSQTIDVESIEALPHT